MEITLSEFAKSSGFTINEILTCLFNNAFRPITCLNSLTKKELLFLIENIDEMITVVHVEKEDISHLPHGMYSWNQNPSFNQ